MDELRRDINKAFDQGQAELGDLSGVRERIVRSALAGRNERPHNRVQLAVAFAVLLVAALVISTFFYVRSGSQPIPAGGLTRPLNVPDSTAVLLFHDSTKPDQIDGVTWDGRTSGRVGQGEAMGGTSNPAGTLYSTSTAIRGRSGTAVFATKGFMTGAWADDERQFCQMSPKGGLDTGTPAILSLVPTDGPPMLNGVQIGTYPAVATNLPPPSVAACSVENDRAVVFQATDPSALAVQDWVVQLSTGRILWTHSIKVPGSPVGIGIAATHDGRYVAETVWSAGQVTATIYGPDGSAISHLAAFVQAFSWDGSLVVTSASSGSTVSLVRWRDGAVLWTGPEGFHFVGARSEPGGSRIAIGITDKENPTGLAQARTANLYVLSADGQVLWMRNRIYLA